MKIFLTLLLIVSLFAEDKTERKLADALIKANREAVELKTKDKAREAAADADSKHRYDLLDGYCKSKDQRGAVRQDTGVIGCWPVVPIPPPGTNPKQ